MKLGNIEKVSMFISGLKAKIEEIAKQTRKVATDDPRRLIHSLKAGLALTLVSLFYYFQPLYTSFGISAMWAVVTVVVVFEFTVGKFGLAFETETSNVIICMFLVHVTVMFHLMLQETYFQVQHLEKA